MVGGRGAAERDTFLELVKGHGLQACGPPAEMSPISIAETCHPQSIMSVWRDWAKEQHAGLRWNSMHFGWIAVIFTSNDEETGAHERAPELSLITLFGTLLKLAIRIFLFPPCLPHWSRGYGGYYANTRS